MHKHAGTSLGVVPCLREAGNSESGLWELLFRVKAALKENLLQVTHLSVSLPRVAL